MMVNKLLHSVIPGSWKPSSFHKDNDFFANLLRNQHFFLKLASVFNYIILLYASSNLGCRYGAPTR